MDFVDIDPLTGAVGMASIMLYEAWLLGRRVLSLQPNLHLEPLRALGRRDGVVLIDTPDGAAQRIREWTALLYPASAVSPRPELRRHECAAKAILDLIDTLALPSR
jgi:hypothetical protein